MKKVLLFAAAFLVLLSCSKNNASTDVAGKPSVAWEANPNFDVMEISVNMNAKVVVKLPEAASSFTVTLSKLPIELIGVANKIIGIQANKATSSKAGVLDLIEDSSVAQAANRMGFSTSVGAALKSVSSVTLDFSKLLEELAADSPLANQSGFTFKVAVVDRNGAKLEKDVRFNWTSAPEISSDYSFPYTLTAGTTTPLVLNIDAKGKIAGITLQFDGDAEKDILAWIKKRNGGSEVIDLMKEGTATAFGLPAASDIKDKTQLNLNITNLMTNFSYEAKTAGSYYLLIKVVDALGKETMLSMEINVPAAE
jgi:hypothetical protein